jgi:hypothetical protein
VQIRANLPGTGKGEWAIEFYVLMGSELSILNGSVQRKTSVDPEADPLKWLDDGLPDLSGFECHYFDLTAQFDISRYTQILRYWQIASPMAQQHPAGTPSSHQA